MKGKYRVIVQNKRIKYDFEVKRNITIIRGDSATGKTALVDMIREYYENGEESGIELVCERNCAVVEGRNWKAQLDLLENSIIFIDEGNSFVSSKEFAKTIQESSNYYVIITRESLAALPYAVNEIYGIRNSGKYGNLKKTYNEMYGIYNLDTILSEINPEIVITEDSNAGYQFFESICQKQNLRCLSAEGKSNIFSMVEKEIENTVLIIADGAAFGPEIEKIIKLMQVKKQVNLYLPESFEWLVLKSEIFSDSEIHEIITNPYEHIDSKKFFSWERYFTHVLIDKTKDTYRSYSKRVLNQYYLQDAAVEKILKVMKRIDFAWKNSKKET